jgi:pimeloyl-ACP methyl ester carboxylesterase
MRHIHVHRTGKGRPLLLLHGLGGSWRSWTPVLAWLEQARDVIAIDLPGHGASPARPDSGTFAGLADSVDTFIRGSGLTGIDVAGSSLGARLALELARRGSVGRTVALNPGGFWKGWERTLFKTTIAASVRLLRATRPVLPMLSRNAAARSLLLAQLSAHPWRLDGPTVATELVDYARTPTFDALVRDLGNGPRQHGPAAPGSGPVVIGWGRHDRLCLPRQAARAQAAFPSARLHWFEHSGHFPAWDEPAEAARLMLGER